MTKSRNKSAGTRTCIHVRAVTFTAGLMLSASASAFQPVELGLAPLYDRLNAIDSDRQLINQRLQAAETSARDRAFAYRRYQALEKERHLLAQEIVRFKELSRSPLVTFMAPTPEAQ